MHDVRLTAAARLSHPHDHRSERSIRSAAVPPSAGLAPDPVLDPRIPISYNYRGESNRFYLTATFADCETRESVIAHTHEGDRLESAPRRIASRVSGRILRSTMPSIADHQVSHRPKAIATTMLASADSSRPTLNLEIQT